MLERKDETSIDNKIDRLKKHIETYTSQYNTCLSVYDKYSTAFFNDSSPDNKKRIEELNNYSITLHEQIVSIEKGTNLEANDHFNDYLLLKIKACAMRIRCMTLTASAPEDILVKFKFHKENIIDFINKYLPRLQFSHDIVCTNELCYLASDLFTTHRKITTKWPEYLSVNNSYFTELFWMIGSRLPDSFLKLFSITPIAIDRISQPDEQMCKVKKGAAYQQILSVYKTITQNYQNQINHNEYDNTNIIEHISCSWLMFYFTTQTHPRLRAMDIAKLLATKNKAELQSYFKIHQDSITSYLEKIIQLLSLINLDKKNISVRNIGMLRSIGHECIDLINTHFCNLTAWHQLLQVNDNFWQSCKRFIIEFTDCSMQITSFYENFFDLYPESNHGTLSEYSHLIHPDDDFQNQMFSIKTLHGIRQAFQENEIFRENEFKKEMQERLRISSEAADFLITLEGKQKTWHKRWNKNPESKAIVIVPKKVNKRGKQPKPVQTDNNDISANIFAPYFDQAWKYISTHKYRDAAIIYKLAYDKAIAMQADFQALRALDGLIMTDAHLLLKQLSILSSILNTRLQTDKSISRENRIQLEVLIKDILLKLNSLSQFHDDLNHIAAKPMKLAPEISAGIRFSRELIKDVITYINTEFKQIKNDYQAVKRKSHADKCAFKLKLAKEHANKQRWQLSQKELIELGDELYEHIGEKNHEKLVADSQYTNERAILHELTNSINYAASACENICGLFKGNKKVFTPRNPEHIVAKSHMKKSVIQVSLPANIIDDLNRFKQPACLIGEAVQDLIILHQVLPHTHLAYIAHVSEEHNLPILNAEIKPIQETIPEHMAKQPFTIMTLFCSHTGLLHDTTGRGLRDLDQMRIAMTDQTAVDTQFHQHPELIWSVLILESKGFHADLNILDAINHLPPLDKLQQNNFKILSQTHFVSLNQGERIKVARLLLQYGLLQKLFALDHSGSLSELVQTLEKQLNITSLSIANNINSKFSAKDIPILTEEIREDKHVNNNKLYRKRD